MSGLGTRWDTPGVNRDGACRVPIHPALEALRGLQREHGVRAEQVARMRVWLDEGAYKAVGFGWEPTTVTSAQMNLQYCAAQLLLEGDVFVDQFTDAKLAAVLDMVRHERFTTRRWTRCTGLPSARCGWKYSCGRTDGRDDGHDAGRSGEPARAGGRHREVSQDRPPLSVSNRQDQFLTVDDEGEWGGGRPTWVIASRPAKRDAQDGHAMPETWGTRTDESGIGGSSR